MNPYQILGVAINCTRAEAKEAFRIRAYHAHPDRGGDTKTFIRIRRAYEQVLAELERQRVPDADKTEPVVDKSTNPHAATAAPSRRIAIGNPTLSCSTTLPSVLVLLGRAIPTGIPI